MDTSTYDLTVSKWGFAVVGNTMIDISAWYISFYTVSVDDNDEVVWNYLDIAF